MISLRPRPAALLPSLGLVLAAAAGVLIGGQSGGMLAMFALSTLIFGALGLLPTLRAVELERRIPTHWDAGKPLDAEVVVRLRRPLPWLVLDLSDGAPATLAQKHPARRTMPLFLRRRVELRWSAAPERGVFVLPPVLLTLRDPFDLFPRTLASGPEEIEIWPRRIALPPGSVRRRMAEPEELAGTRPFSAGDSPRQIIWKRYAREGRLEVRRWAPRGARALDLVLDPSPGPGFELLVSLAASLAESALADGREVGVLVLGRPELAIAAAKGLAQVRRVMELLCRLGPGEPPSNDAPESPPATLAPDPDHPGAVRIRLGGLRASVGSLVDLRDLIAQQGLPW